MPTPDDYARYARECVRWAAAAKTDEQRFGYLSLAWTWTQAALLAAQETAVSEPRQRLVRNS